MSSVAGEDFVRIRQNYFELFGLPKTYLIDIDYLESSYLKLQTQIHPDQHLHDGGRLLAVQYTECINEAYDILKSPLLRAKYWLELIGVSVDFTNTTIANNAFLLKEMERREALAKINDKNTQEVQLLIQEADKENKQLQNKFSKWTVKPDVESEVAIQWVQQMYFLEKFIADAHKICSF